MAGEISIAASLLGISPTVLIIALVWSLAWKAIALWKSARNKHLVWFVMLLIINTMGILEILYIFLFSKCCFEAKPRARPKTRKTTRRKR